MKQTHPTFDRTKDRQPDPLAESSFSLKNGLLFVLPRKQSFFLFTRPPSVPTYVRQSLRIRNKVEERRREILLDQLLRARPTSHRSYKLSKIGPLFESFGYHVHHSFSSLSSILEMSFFFA
jgi:hypothetical protein